MNAADDQGPTDRWSAVAVCFGGPAIAGLVRCARPARGPVWWWTHLVRPGHRPVVVRDHDVPPPRGTRLEVRAEGLWGEFLPETPGEHWSVGLEAFGLRIDAPTDDSVGERTPVGLDVEWERRGAAVVIDGGVVVPGVVFGEVLIGAEVIAVDLPGALMTRRGPGSLTELGVRVTRDGDCRVDALVMPPASDDDHVGACDIPIGFGRVMHVTARATIDAMEWSGHQE